SSTREQRTTAQRFARASPPEAVQGSAKGRREQGTASGRARPSAYDGAEAPGGGGGRCACRGETQGRGGAAQRRAAAAPAAALDAGRQSVQAHRARRRSKLEAKRPAARTGPGDHGPAAAA